MASRAGVGAAPGLDRSDCDGARVWCGRPLCGESGIRTPEGSLLGPRLTLNPQVTALATKRPGPAGDSAGDAPGSLCWGSHVVSSRVGVGDDVAGSNGEINPASAGSAIPAPAELTLAPAGSAITVSVQQS